MIDIATIKIEKGKSGAYFATSPDAPGLQVARMTIEELVVDLPKAISALSEAYRRKGREG